MKFYCYYAYFVGLLLGGSLFLPLSGMDEKRQNAEDSVRSYCCFRLLNKNKGHRWDGSKYLHFFEISPFKLDCLNKYLMNAREILDVYKKDTNESAVMIELFCIPARNLKVVFCNGTEQCFSSNNSFSRFDYTIDDCVGETFFVVDNKERYNFFGDAEKEMSLENLKKIFGAVKNDFVTLLEKKGMLSLKFKVGAETGEDYLKKTEELINFFEKYNRESVSACIKSLRFIQDFINDRKGEIGLKKHFINFIANDKEFEMILEYLHYYLVPLHFVHEILKRPFSEHKFIFYLAFHGNYENMLSILENLGYEAYSKTNFTVRKREEITRFYPAIPVDGSSSRFCYEATSKFFTMPYFELVIKNALFLCNNCMKYLPPGSRKRCGKCKILYCDRNCQTVDWKRHKKNCYATVTDDTKFICSYENCAKEMVGRPCICTVCKKMPYCSEICLKEDEYTHKKVCKKLRYNTNEVIRVPWG